MLPLLCILRNNETFISAVNDVISEFPNAHPHVKCKLLQIYGTSFYGSCLWDLYSKPVISLYKIWNIALRRLIGVPYKTHTRFLDFLCDIRHLSFLLKRKFISFIISVLKSQNKLIQNLIVNSVFNIASPTGKLLSRILWEYDLGSLTMFQICYDYVLTTLDIKYHDVHGLSEVDFAHCQIIKELLECRHNTYHVELDDVETTAIIDFLTTA